MNATVSSPRAHTGFQHGCSQPESAVDPWSRDDRSPARDAYSVFGSSCEPQDVLWSGPLPWRWIRNWELLSYELNLPVRRVASHVARMHRLQADSRRGRERRANKNDAAGATQVCSTSLVALPFSGYPLVQPNLFLEPSASEPLCLCK